MVRYHEAGRFCEKTEQWDQESAMFHLETAAQCGELEAIVAMGQCCLQLPHHILPDKELEVQHRLYSSFFIFVLAVNASLNSNFCVSLAGFCRKQDERFQVSAAGC